MTVKSIKFYQEVDNAPEYDYREGREWTNQFIYELTNEDGTTQHISFEVDVDSYGTSRSVGKPKMVAKKTKTVEYWG